MEQAIENGICVTTITNLGHTGRHGAFAEHAADAGPDRRRQSRRLEAGGTAWRGHGKAADKSVVPRPSGGDHGPFILDLATSTVAGG